MNYWNNDNIIDSNCNSISSDIEICTEINESNINITSVDNIPKLLNMQKSKLRVERAGVIVYTIYNNEYYFGMGIDTDSGDITDFGGGIKKKDISLIDGGLREFTEESLGVFGKFEPSEIQNCITIYSGTTLIIFIPLILDTKRISEIFKSRVECIKNPEVKSIFWGNRENFMELISGNTVKQHKMYHRIRILCANALKKKNFLNML